MHLIQTYRTQVAQSTSSMWLLRSHHSIRSSQVLFSTTQKLIQHQIINYTDILKWLREVLVCRNTFLLKHRDHANIGSHQAICKHAHIKLEVSVLCP